MPLTCSAEYRSMVLQPTRAGARPVDLAGHLQVNEDTIHRWIARLATAALQLAVVRCNPPPCSLTVHSDRGRSSVLERSVVNLTVPALPGRWGASRQRATTLR